MPIQNIALVPENCGVDSGEIAQVAAALQMQIMRDLGPRWGVRGAVHAFPRLDDVPAGFWPILLCSGPLGDAAGLHLDEQGQPYAQVELSPTWSLDASRACLEMLVNPSGTQTAPSTQLHAELGTVYVLLEVCGPCGCASAYTIGTVLVSDFCTPAFFEEASSPEPHEPYSHRGALETPLRPLPGGHLTWLDPLTNRWWLRRPVGNGYSEECLGNVEWAARSVHDLLRMRAREDRAPEYARAAWDAPLAAQRERAQRSSALRAKQLRDLIELRSVRLLGPAKALSLHGAETQDASNDAYDPELELAVEMLTDDEAGDIEHLPETGSATQPELRDAELELFVGMERSEMLNPEASQVPPTADGANVPPQPASRAVERDSEVSPSIIPISAPHEPERANERGRAMWWTLTALASAALLIAAWSLRPPEAPTRGKKPRPQAAAPHASAVHAPADHSSVPLSDAQLPVKAVDDVFEAREPTQPATSPPPRSPALPRRRARPRTRPGLPAENVPAGIAPTGSERGEAEQASMEQPSAHAADPLVVRSIEDLIESRR